MRFFTNALLVLRGAVIGQVIPILAMPFIARLFSPDEYGIYGSILGLAVILSTILNLQLDVAVVLPKEEEEAERLMRVSCALSIYGTLFFSALIAALMTCSDVYNTFAHLSWWILAAPALAFFMAYTALANHIAIRRQHYRDIGAAAAMLQIGFCSAALTSGIGAPVTGSLVVSRITGQMFAIGAYARSTRILSGAMRRGGWPGWAEIRATIAAYRKFAFFTAPYVFTTSVSREIISVILLFFNHPAAAGFYMLARSLLLIPSSLLSTSLGQVFYREASRALRDPQFQSFTYRLMGAVAIVLAPLCVYITQWGPAVFAAVFGDEWAQAGVYAMMLMPFALLHTMTSFVGRVFEVAGKQDVLFRLLAAFDVVSIAALAGALAMGFGPLAGTGAYIACQIVYMLVYLGLVFRLMGFAPARYALMLGSAMALAGLQLVISLGLELAIDARGLLFAAQTLACVALSGGLTLFSWRRIKASGFLQQKRDVNPYAESDIVY